MRTIAETFLELNAARAPRPERPHGPSAPDLLAIFDATRDAYLAQPGMAASDAELAPGLFEALRALIVLPADPGVPAIRATSLPLLSAHRLQPGVSSSFLLTAAPILAAVLIASITLGTLSLSVVLTLALALLAWFGGGGRLFGFALPARTAPPAGTTPSQARIEAPSAPTRTPGLARLEDAFRQADAVLARMREVRAPERALSLDSTLDQGHLQFLQDLAEAGTARDGEHLVQLVSRRLPAVAQGQNLSLATFEDAPGCFVVDEASDPARRGTTTTLRPAILRGERCVARGYARRYV